MGACLVTQPERMVEDTISLYRIIISHTTTQNLDAQAVQLIAPLVRVSNLKLTLPDKSEVISKVLDILIELHQKAVDLKQFTGVL